MVVVRLLDVSENNEMVEQANAKRRLLIIVAKRLLGARIYADIAENMLVNVSPELPWSIGISHVSGFSGTPGEGRPVASLFQTRLTNRVRRS
jgi:hypothetical protein